LKGIAVLPLQDVPAAVAELRRVVKDYGMVGAVLPADGLPRPLGHPEFHPVYEEANRLGCMLAVHSQNSLRNNDLFMWRGEAATLAHVWPQMRQFKFHVFRVLGRLPNCASLFWRRAAAGCYLISKMEPRGQARKAFDVHRARTNLFSMRRGTDNAERSGASRRSLLGIGFPHEGIVDMAAAVKEFLTREDIARKQSARLPATIPSGCTGYAAEGL
jgi:hypothetical protein